MEIIYKLGAFISVGLLFIGYLFKVLLMNRIEKLEENMTHTINEEEVRTILSDKIEPIQEDIKDIKNNIRNIFDILLKNNRD